ncbi:hypothetical protein TNCV_4414361 [Trichonephila clavipes]|uniref:Uncharacterized protein n=1 Tax=Trichonephila clavipes TaxID=2585209 RepID=A0A8X6S3Y5_TRICX|nr:hypothetical protein TNCV_4414361 [Trichonephila clavipes]
MSSLEGESLPLLGTELTAKSSFVGSYDVNEEAGNASDIILESAIHSSGQGGGSRGKKEKSTGVFKRCHKFSMELRTGQLPGPGQQFNALCTKTLVRKFYCGQNPAEE